MPRLLVMMTVALLAGASAFGVRAWLTAQQQQAALMAVQARAEPEKRKAILVAAKDLPAGFFIQPDTIRWQEWPDVDTPETYLERGKRSEEEFVGAVVRRPVAAGEPLAAGNIVKPGDRGFLAAVLEPGMRAVSVAVDDTSSNAGLIFPGDRVDLILTQTIGTPEDPAGARRVSETVLKDVRVIAMGRRLNGETGEDKGRDSARTATLEVTPADAEKVTLVGELGKLALSLRSLATKASESEPVLEPPRYTWDSDVSTVLRRENQPHSTFTVIRGEKAEIVTVRGGEGL